MCIMFISSHFLSGIKISVLFVVLIFVDVPSVSLIHSSVYFCIFLFYYEHVDFNLIVSFFLG